MKTEIYLRRKNKVIVNIGPVAHNNMQYIGTMLKNIETLGYSFTNGLINALCTLTKADLDKFYLRLVHDLKELVGAHVRHEPMYPNFPKQVMVMSEAEWYINAIIHYWSDGKLFPEYEKEERLPLYKEGKIKFIDIGDNHDFALIFTNIMKSKTSISQTDKDDLLWFFGNFKSYSAYMPDDIPHKETAALVCKFLIEEASVKAERTGMTAGLYIKTATDVLRLMTAMSDGDLSLATNTKFRSFKRRERRILMTLLENCGNIEENMVRHKNKWIRAGERLHPSEFKAYPKTKEAFNKIRNGIKIEAYNSLLEKTIVSGGLNGALELLELRPGMFARKLDLMLRTAGDAEAVIESFRKVAPKVSVPVLLQVREHFMHRHGDARKDTRIFFPKGNVSRAYIVNNELPDIEGKHCEAVAEVCRKALIEVFAGRGPMGKVYLAPEFKNYNVPFSQRSASKALKSVVRGSRFGFGEDTKVFRGFIWWKNGIDRTDIDLSVAFYDEDWQYLSVASYYMLQNEEYGAYHSGDIVDAPYGASEFLDVDIEQAAGAGCRYAVFSINSYTQQPYCDLPECFGGWMERKEPQSGEIFEAKTVQNKIDITAKCKACIPMIVDLEERQVIWADMALTVYPRLNNNVEKNRYGIAATCKSITETIKPNLHDLISLHIEARGTACSEKDGADVVFDTCSGVTPFDTEVFMGEYL